MSSDFCIRCDNELAVYCGPCVDAIRREADRLRDERSVLRARLVDCRPWVGVCPWPDTPAWSEVIALRDLADKTLEEIKP